MEPLSIKTCKIYSVVQHVHCTSYMAPPQKRKYLKILQFFPEFYQKKSRDQSSSTKNTVSHNKSSNLTTDGQMRAHIHTHTTPPSSEEVGIYFSPPYSQLSHVVFCRHQLNPSANCPQPEDHILLVSARAVFFRLTVSWKKKKVKKMLRTLQNYQITGITGGMYVIVMFKISI